MICRIKTLRVKTKVSVWNGSAGLTSPARLGDFVNWIYRQLM